MFEHPLTGVGIHAFPIAEGDSGLKEDEGFGVKYSAAHNSFIQVGAELGFPGLLAFIGLLYSSVIGCIRTIHRSAHSGTKGVSWRHTVDGVERPATGAFFMVMVGSVFLTFAFHPLTYFVLAICLSVRLEQYLQPITPTRLPAPAPSARLALP